MAKVQLDTALASITGSLGKFVYKHYRNDKRGQVLSRKPDISRVKWSPAQRAHRQRMKSAAAFHRQVLLGWTGSCVTGMAGRGHV
jgi:hypothetical protein